MSRDQLRHIQTLIETGQIEEARTYLETNADGDPNIQKMLDNFNERFPPPKSEIADLFELGGERDQQKLAQARQLLQKNRFADARALLTQLQHMPKARQWLEELNELEAELRQEAQDAANAKREPVSTTQAIGDFVRSSNFRIMTGSIVILFALIIVFGFFIFTFTESNIVGRINVFAEIDNVTISPEKTSCTAFNIWRGEETCQQTFALDQDLSSQAETTGFVAVRLVDRFLAAMPIGAIILIILAWVYMQEILDALMGLMAIAGTAIALLMFPIIWQQISDDTGTNADVAQELLPSTMHSLIDVSYNTSEYMILAAIVLIVCILAMLIMMAELSGMLGVPRNLLTAKGEVEPDLLKVFEERKRLGR